MGEAIEKNTVKAENQVKKEQMTYYLGDPDAPLRVAIVGNSITRHGIAEEIGWTRLCGMAASDEQHDYVHVLHDLLGKRGQDAYYMVNQLSYWERHFHENILENYADIREFSPDVLVFRLGENVDGTMANEEFAKQIEELITYIAPKSQVVMTTCFMRYSLVDNILREVASRLGYPMVELNDLGDNPEMMPPAGAFWHDGIMRHPGDRGMAVIAQRIADAITR